MFGHVQCVSYDSLCHDQLGYSSSYNSLYGQCECSSGYLIYNGTCTYGNTACSLLYGSHAEYNYLSKGCECEDGYTLNDENECVEKQNNVYFVLTELDTDNDEAIIRSVYDGTYYRVSYGVGCYSWAFDDYLSENIVVNLGTDFDLDVFDEIILPDDDQSCYITSVQQVDSDETLVVPDIESYYYVAPVSYSEPSEADVVATDLDLVERLKGSILLQTEEHGEAWYVNPQDGNRYYMRDGSIAYGMMRSFGLGITDLDLSSIPAVLSTDEMKNSASICEGNSVAASTKGKILLQVEEHGEAWYVSPDKCRRIYMKDGDTAYTIMRYMGLGITNSDLKKIPSGSI